MTRTVRLLATASGLAVAALGASPAFAAGTASNTTITNNVTLSYQVGGVGQTAINASNQFIVDRKVNFTVSEQGAATTSVSPGQLAAFTTFLVTNTSNATLDFSLATTQAGVLAKHGGTDNFDATNVRIYEDTNGSGGYNAGDTLITYLDQVVADGTRTVFVVVDIPGARVTNDVAAVRLTGTAAEATAAGSLGAVVTQSAGANGNMTLETVFADTAANGNTARDGIDFDRDDYTVLGATLTVTKTSRIISDPFNLAVNPKMIPGAIVEYCVAVANAAGSATATGVGVSDALPAQTLFVAGSGRINGTVTGPTCNADGVAGGTEAPVGTVTATLADIAAGVTRTFLFQVTVQ